jgi:hypothetical protein
MLSRQFRRLLLLAMASRAIMIPVQIWVNPIWAQFVADTIPEMTFASAWTLLVSFFVQLVGVASGSGNSFSPGLVIQITAYVVYVVLLGTYFWNPVASVLLYALMCCIYAALFGTALYFCPRLLLLLQPSLSRNSKLAIRLATCSILCVVVFGGRTIGFARKVVAPPKSVSWWWQYGALELVPSILFLLMMHPKSPASTATNSEDGTRTSSANGNSRQPRTSFSNTTGGSRSPGAGAASASHKSQDSSSYGSRQPRSGESAPLLKSGALYGTAATTMTTTTSYGGASAASSTGGDATT